jgi:anti-sigma regulatory factor (Ser/Thr protein kinase)
MAERAVVRLTLAGPDELAGARRAVASAVCRCGSQVDLDEALLLTEELCANALRYGGGEVALEVRISEGKMTVEVTDPSPDLPVLGHPEEMDESGWGLSLVDRLASSWGTRSLPGDGKVVWFEARAGPPRSP